MQAATRARCSASTAEGPDERRDSAGGATSLEFFATRHGAAARSVVSDQTCSDKERRRQVSRQTLCVNARLPLESGWLARHRPMPTQAVPSRLSWCWTPREAVPMALERWYDSHGFGCHLGNLDSSGHPGNLGSDGQAAIRPWWPTITFTPLENCTRHGPNHRSPG